MGFDTQKFLEHCQKVEEGLPVKKHTLKVDQEELLKIQLKLVSLCAKMGIEDVTAILEDSLMNYRLGGGGGSKAVRNNKLFHGYLSKISFASVNVPDSVYKTVGLTPPVSKVEAIYQLQKEMGYQSPQACFQALKREIKRRRDAGISVPEILPNSELIT